MSRIAAHERRKGPPPRGFVEKLRSNVGFPSAEELLYAGVPRETSLRSSSSSEVVDDVPNDDVLPSGLSDTAMRSIKGVCASPMYLHGLFGRLPENVTVRFVGCDVRQADAERIMEELARGIYAHDAVPWLSLESTADRSASRVSTLHPCYRDTLVGAVCLEVDVALKAVGGTAHGGLFCDAAERARFLRAVCSGGDWGPNGQRRREGWGDLAAIQREYPSFRTSESLLGTDAIARWKKEWEAAWDGETTGADVAASVKRVALYPQSHHLDVETTWTVDIHANAGSPEARAVARRGEALCRELLPRVPVPRCDWAPPGARLDALLGLLRVAAGLASILVAGRTDAPNLIPAPLAESTRAAWPTARTPRWIPFEPAVDDSSGAVFLGGGVAIGAAAADAVASRDGPPPAADGATLTLRFVRCDVDGLRRAREASADATALFLDEVAALGLREHYASIHVDALSSSSSRRPSAEALAGLLRELFPDGYARRHMMGRCRLASRVLGRDDVSRLLAEGDAAVAVAAEESPFRERVELMNGDVYDGHWRFGRMHGKGTYTFASGARYEGQWDNGKMSGIGFFTTDAGERHCVDHRRSARRR